MASFQEGIFWERGEVPPPCFSIVFLRAAVGQGASAVGETLAKIWTMLEGLKKGEVRDLPGHPVPASNLRILIGFGEKAFALSEASLPLPEHLGPQYRFRSALPGGGGPLLVGSGLRYSNDVKQNPATEEIVLQFVADSQLATSRAIVEIWKLLHDNRDEASETAPLQIASFFTGFQREDRRSWIDFHDGVSNLEKGDQRRRVIGIKPNAQDWTVDGTYLAFMRIGVDLATWRRLPRGLQEILVGRDKLTGCALQSIGPDGRPVAAAGCPFGGSGEITDPGNGAFREPPVTGDPVILRSHVQRANHHKTDFERPDSLRIYRQGYDFHEAIAEAPGFRAGLNFVSFQDTPERLLRMLTTGDWLGRINFGGKPSPNEAPDLLSVRAAGVYFVPPVLSSEAFPGASIFGIRPVA